jgi:hypothetical protein
LRKLQRMQARNRLTLPMLERDTGFYEVALDAHPGYSARILGNCKCFAIACLIPSRTKQRHFSPGANMEISYAPAASPYRMRRARRKTIALSLSQDNTAPPSVWIVGDIQWNDYFANKPIYTSSLIN